MWSSIDNGVPQLVCGICVEVIKVRVECSICKGRLLKHDSCCLYSGVGWVRKVVVDIRNQWDLAVS